jgi:hypothetical protein
MSEQTARLHVWAGTTEWMLLGIALQVSARVYCSGPPGIGKSFLAANDPRPAYPVTLSDDLTVQDLVGHYLPDGNKFVWHDGPVAMAMKEGARLILNELHLGSGAVRDFLLGVLDRQDIGGIAMPNGERLVARDGFDVVATSNSPPSVLTSALRRGSRSKSRSRRRIQHSSPRLTPPSPGSETHSPTASRIRRGRSIRERCRRWCASSKRAWHRALRRSCASV